MNCNKDNRSWAQASISKLLIWHLNLTRHDGLIPLTQSWLRDQQNLHPQGLRKHSRTSKVTRGDWPQRRPRPLNSDTLFFEILPLLSPPHSPSSISPQSFQYYHVKVYSNISSDGGNIFPHYNHHFAPSSQTHGQGHIRSPKLFNSWGFGCISLYSQTSSSS